MADQTNIAGSTNGNNIQLTNQILDVWAQEVLFTAQPNLRFESVAQVRTELTVTPGQTIKFLKYSSLTGVSDIAETATIDAASLSTSMIPISVGEHAKAVAFSELLLRTSADQVLDRASTVLGMHYAVDRDRMIRDALLTSPQTLYANGRSSRAGLQSGDYFNMELIRDAVELLATKKAPKYNSDAYVCFVHPHQTRRLRSDGAWVNVQNYASPENMLTGEIGRIDDVRFVDSTQITLIKSGTQQIWADNLNTGTTTSVAANNNTDVYQSIIVGDWAVGLAEGLPVELRDNGVVDFGRKHALAYYGIWGAGLIESGFSAVLETA